VRTFFDSSAFAKRFTEESGSAEVESLCEQATELGVSVICVPEILSALNRKQREADITADEYSQAKRALIRDVRDADILHLTPDVIAVSARVLETSPVRAMDALHIACALEWNAGIFVSADLRQCDAAQTEGLNVQRILPS
jgi:predicted nucleic acid-binding protein